MKYPLPTDAEFVCFHAAAKEAYAERIAILCEDQPAPPELERIARQEARDRHNYELGLLPI